MHNIRSPAKKRKEEMVEIEWIEFATVIRNESRIEH